MVQAVQAAVFLAVTQRWKMSVHCAAASGLARVCCWLYGTPAAPVATLVPAMAWARVALDRHTFAQTAAGTAAGCAPWLLALGALSLP